MLPGILDLIQGEQGQKIISSLSSQTGQSEGQTQNLLQMALPVLMGAMKKNSASPEGAQNLMGALNKHGNSDLLGNIEGLFNGGVDQNVKDEGQGILNHLLGSEQSQVETALGAQTGMDSSAVSEILKVAAPLLMGALGKQTSQAGISDGNQLSSLLGGLMGQFGGGNAAGGNSGVASVLSSFLDADGDGSIIDDVTDIVSGKQQGGIGGLLGNIFGKK